MKAVIAALLLLPAVALASSVFDGTWKVRPESMKVTGKADQFDVIDGMYICESCVPGIRVKADGTDQKVEGHDYYDSIAVTVVSPSSIHIIQKRGGKQVFNVTHEVSADGKTLTSRFEDYTGTKVATGKFTSTRRAAGQPGSHQSSGSWQPDVMADANEAMLTYGYQMTNEQFSMHWNGQSYNAKFDGKEYPVHNDPGKTMVTLKRLSDSTVEETDRRQGKVTDEIRLAAAKDGKSIEVTDKDIIHHQIVTFTLEKQE